MMRCVIHDEKSFLKRTVPEPNTGCFLWLGATIPKGYGSVTYKNKAISTHRLAWQLKNGAIPKGKMVLHKCDTPACVNAEHLFIGTAKQNTQDMLQKNRCTQKNKTQCPKGHFYSTENTYINGRGHRICKRCNADRALVNCKKRKLGV